LKNTKLTKGEVGMNKRLLISFLAAIVVVGLAGTLYATPTYVFLKTTGVDPSSSGLVHLPNLGDKNVYYGEYDLAIDWDMGAYNYEAISGFCVENAYATSLNGIEYKLLTPSDLGPNYVYGAYILDQYLKGNISAQAGQLATWEAVMDPGSTDVTLTSTNFYTKFTNDYTAEANKFLNAMYNEGIGGFTGAAYKIARNPVVSDPGTDYQDYVISVPDASLMFLLGSALLGLGLFGRRRSEV